MGNGVELGSTAGSDVQNSTRCRVNEANALCNSRRSHSGNIPLDTMGLVAD